MKRLLFVENNNGNGKPQANAWPFFKRISTSWFGYIATTAKAIFYYAKPPTPAGIFQSVIG